MKKKYLILMLLLLVLSIAGCNKTEPVSEVGVDNTISIPEVEADSGDIVAYAAEEDAAEEPTATPESTVTDGEAIEEPTDEVVEEEPVVLYAKTYKQVYPDLYNFYPENPAYKYSQWVFTIDSSSSFIGSITLPDGTVIVGGGEPGDKEDTTIDISSGDYTGGNKPEGSTAGGSATGDNQGQSDVIVDVVAGDPNTNPDGDDYTLQGGKNEDGVDITTKTIKDAVTTDTATYTFKFDVEDVHYIMESLTAKQAKNIILDGDLYETANGVGDVTEDESKRVETAKGTYRLYNIELIDGAVKQYIATFTPTWSTSSVYVLSSDNLDNNEDLLTMLQLLVVE